MPVAKVFAGRTVSGRRIYALNTDPNVRKECSVCKKNYPATLAYFNKAMYEPLGVRNICKWCRRPKTREYRTRIGNEKSRAWYWENRTEFLMYCKLRNERLGNHSRSAFRNKCIQLKNS